MKLDDVRSYFGQPDAFQWVPLSALKAGERLACIDGRHGRCVVAGPGGDLGEFITLAAAIEEAIGEVTHVELDAWLGEIMEWHSRFYCHTDEHALQALGARLRSLPEAAEEPGLDDPAHVANLVRHPPPQLRDHLFDLLVESEFVGCGHLQCLVRDPKPYGVRPGLAAQAMQSFFHRMWDGSPSADFVVVEGEHAEEAFLEIEVGDSESRSSSLFVPSIRSGAGKRSMVFCNHEPARDYLRHENLMLLAGAGLIPHTIDLDAVLDRAEVLARNALKTTVNALAPGLPHFVVRFDPYSHVPTIVET